MAGRESRANASATSGSGDEVSQRVARGAAANEPMYRGGMSNQ